MRLSPRELESYRRKMGKRPGPPPGQGDGRKGEPDLRCRERGALVPLLSYKATPSRPVEVSRRNQGSVGERGKGTRAGVENPKCPRDVWIVLPVPPPMNHRLIPVRGRMVKSSADREYMRRVQAICVADGLRPVDGDVEVEIKWYRKQRKGDVQERFKSLLDALQGFAYHDDAQICDYRVVRDDSDKKNPRAVVHIRRADATT